jgi:hypothetical protein
MMSVPAVAVFLAERSGVLDDHGAVGAIVLFLVKRISSMSHLLHHLQTQEVAEERRHPPGLLRWSLIELLDAGLVHLINVR